MYFGCKYYPVFIQLHVIIIQAWTVVCNIHAVFGWLKNFDSFICGRIAICILI